MHYFSVYINGCIKMLLKFFLGFYHAMYLSAKRGLGIACRLSVTLMDCDDIGWKSSKIISRLVSLLCSLFASPNITGVCQGEHPQILAGIRVGYEKKLSRSHRDLLIYCSSLHMTSCPLFSLTFYCKM